MTRIEQGDGWTLYNADCLDVLPTLPDASFDAILTDPPYPHIKRDYGMWTADEWLDMMRRLVPEFRRVLKPSGSCMMVLQPNSERVGRMRTWLWEFMAWVGKEWGIVQDVYWWNVCAIPEAHAIQGRLARPSVKMCLWLGTPECWRDQEAVLWSESEVMKAEKAARRISRPHGRFATPSGHGNDYRRFMDAADRRGGVTPFNLIPLANSNSQSSAGAHGHGAGTPLELCRWWTRYVVPDGGAVLDPFCGSGTFGVAALEHGASYVGIEKMDKYIPIAEERLRKAETAQRRLALEQAV